MTHIKSLITIIFLTLSLTTVGQTMVPSTKILRKTFENIFKENKKAGYKFTSWAACNLDSSFYNSDTVKLVSDDNYFFDNGCCKTARLSFVSKNGFYLTSAQTCKEPSSVTVAKGSNYYKLSFSTAGQYSVLVFTNIASKEQTEFKVINIDKTVSYYKGELTALTLVRIK